MARYKFDWSSLDRSTLYSFMYEARKDIVGKELTIDQIHRILSTQAKKYLPIKTKMIKTAEQEHGIIYIGGCYYGDDDKNKSPRFVEICFSYFVWDHVLKITDYRWKRICKVFADTVLHEIIHIKQYRSRRWKDIPGYKSTAHSGQQRKNQNYYGHPDEIGAYAFNIACELYDRFGSNHQAIKRYLDSNRVLKHKSSSYLRYFRTFDYNHNHAVIKKLKKKVIHYLPYTVIGKPFKTSEYLTS
jgi:hypothetical protein